MKSGKNGKKHAIIVLSIMLIVTIVLGILGFSGLSIPPKGLYKVLPWLPTTDSDNWPESLPLGLDLRGGMYVEYSAKAPAGSEADFDTLMQGTIDIITARLTNKQLTECNVQRIGTDGLRVEIPTQNNGTADFDDSAVLDLIGKAAVLEFKDPEGNIFMDGTSVKTAQAIIDNEKNDYQVYFTLTDEGRETFAEMTGKSIGKEIAIYLDGELLIAPTVQTAITEGSGVISGMGSYERATNIAIKIQSGALPLILTQQKLDRVSATLGQDAISTSVLAAGIGILLVMVLMIFRYRMNGLMASWALCLYVIILFMLIAIFGI